MKIFKIILLIAVLISYLNYSSPVLSEEGGQPGGKASPYIIKKGDTLWDISGEYLKNPFLWPNIWKENRYIKNPDLIYPGNSLIIPYATLHVPEAVTAQPSPPVPEMPAVPPSPPPASETEAPATVPAPAVPEAAAPVAVPSPSPLPETPEAPEVPPTVSASPPELEIPEAAPPLPPEPEAVAPALSVPSPSLSEGLVVSSTKSPVTPMIGTELIEAGGYITDRIEGVGIITGSPEERNIFAEGDVVNISLTMKRGEVSVGDRFTIFKRPVYVSHPKTGKRVGMLFIPLGVLEMTRVQGRDAAGKIIRSYTYSSPGDQIQPYRPATPASKVTQKVPDISGYVIESYQGLLLSAEHDIVYLDKGTSDGIIPGAIFHVMEDGSNHAIGEVEVISVQATTSTAIVTKSAEPFSAGSRVVTTIK